MSKKIYCVSTLLVVSVLSLSSSARADLNVVTTVPDLAALAKVVGGSRVSVTSMSLPTQDPHYVDAKPSLALKLNRADVLIAMGMSLERGWLPTLQVGSRNEKIQVSGAGYIDCSVFVHKLGVPTGKVDRSMGDVHPQGNPHYLYDPRQAMKCAKGIAGRLASIDSAHSAEYQRNYENFARQLTVADAKWKERLSSYRGKKLFIFHQSLEYMADWLGFEIADEVEPKPGIAPSPGTVVALIRKGRIEGIQMILQESYISNKTSKLIAAKIGAKVVRFAAGADVRAGQSYIEHMESLVKTLEAANR